ncbi:hypothetical protein [Chondrinema litorale]|uniref:hypothetical protein n=1 Tax=Chondrinema litorale TaxID=2994555 RepID=UPI002542E76B|nr:hypothetical protein [Chondrinema litorale]UZR98458.1 hypothetical protein OQ292_31980 [Chondrinema litorale]
MPEEQNEFDNIMQKINDLDHFSGNAPVYLDKDLHEVLIKLKVAGELKKVSNLISYLVENFIKDNINSIHKTLNNKKNRYLD